jgi:hypothetical protein
MLLSGLLVTKSRRNSYMFYSVRNITFEDKAENRPFSLIVLSNP